MFIEAAFACLGVIPFSTHLYPFFLFFCFTQLYLMLIEAAFACLGVILFSTHFYPLKHLYISSNILNAMILGHAADSRDLVVEFPVVWPLFYFAYIASTVVLLSGLVSASVLRFLRIVPVFRIFLQISLCLKIVTKEKKKYPVLCPNLLFLDGGDVESL